MLKCVDEVGVSSVSFQDTWFTNSSVVDVIGNVAGNVEGCKGIHKVIGGGERTSHPLMNKEIKGPLQVNKDNTPSS